jgi:hypothetical protein
MAQPSASRLPSWSRVFAILTCLWLSGSVIIPAARAQEDFTVTVSLASATVDKAGLVTVTGTLTYSEPAVLAGVDAEVLQPVGRLQTIYGYNSDTLDACDVTPLPVEVAVVPQNGRFVPGTAYVTIFGFACTDRFYETCSGDQRTKPVRLKRAQ